MITEDYVSYEVAKLLKEKGFDEKCRALYTFWFDEVEGPKEDRAENWNIEPRYFSAPTLQMAMQWLRKAHNIHPSIVVDDFDGKAFYRIEGIFVSGSEHRWVSYYPSDDDKTEGLYSTYEKASEAAINYCLENLI